MDDKAVEQDDGPPQCDHNRLLEAERDRAGNRTDKVRCCECGALVHRPSHHSPRS
jgi:hypothetical protein